MPVLVGPLNVSVNKIVIDKRVVDVFEDEFQSRVRLKLRDCHAVESGKHARGLHHTVLGNCNCLDAAGLCETLAKRRKTIACLSSDDVVCRTNATSYALVVDGMVFNDVSSFLYKILHKLGCLF